MRHARRWARTTWVYGAIALGGLLGEEKHMAVGNFFLWGGGATKQVKDVIQV